MIKETPKTDAGKRVAKPLKNGIVATVPGMGLVPPSQVCASKACGEGVQTPATRARATLRVEKR